MTFKFLILGALLTFAFVGCATSQRENRLKTFKDIDWSKINRSNIEQVIGKPDTTGTIYKSNTEALVYFVHGSQEPQLTVLFDSVNGKILSANWFAVLPSDHLTLQQTKDSFPNYSFISPPAIQDGAWGKKVAVYSASQGALRLAIDENTQKLNSLFWQFDNKNEKTRRPTSH